MLTTDWVPEPKRSRKSSSVPVVSVLLQVFVQLIGKLAGPGFCWWFLLTRDFDAPDPNGALAMWHTVIALVCIIWTLYFFKESLWRWKIE